MNPTLIVPPGGGCFEGHFPGRPILPGVVLLDWAARALASGQECALRGIAFARLRQLVVPGDRLELAARPLDGGRVRIDVLRGDTLAANAELYLGAPAVPPPAQLCPAVLEPERSAPAFDALIPHRPPMRLVASIVRETADGLLCAACIPPGCPLAEHGAAPALAGVEAAAQTAAVWEALRRWRRGDGGAARIGYLVALRDVVLFAEKIAVDAPILAAVQLEAAAPPLTHYRIETCVAGKVVLRGSIATYLA